MYLMPKELNILVSEEEITEIEDVDEENFDKEVYVVKKVNKITWWILLTNKNCFFALLTCIIGSFNVVFFEGFVAETLVKMGLN